MKAILILLILLHFNLFKGWFMALWIIDVSLWVIKLILDIICDVLEKLNGR